MEWLLDPTNVATGLPLEGVRVLDLSRVLAGPLCAMVAGDLGADVIKVEAPAGDPVRSLAPPRFGDDATYYLAVNRHRRNIVADLRDPMTSNESRAGAPRRRRGRELPAESVRVPRHRAPARGESRVRLGERDPGDERRDRSPINRPSTSWRRPVPGSWA